MERLIEKVGGKEIYENERKRCKRNERKQKIIENKRQKDKCMSKSMQFI